MAKIIVIDDERIVCNMLRGLFEMEGYEVFTELDPVKGIELVKKEKPDCVFLDVKMPKVGGMEVLSKIKAIDSKTNVIMISAYGNTETVIEAVKMGAFDYIAKPFDLDFIKNLVKQCLEEKK